METRMDFLQLLETDMALTILKCLDDAADLIRASAVSRFWHDFVITNGLCKQLCLRTFPELSNVSRVIEPRRIKTQSVDAFEREHRAYGSLFKALTAIKVKDCMGYAVSASSTDRFPEESVDNTLNPRDKVDGDPFYWSSQGQSNPDVPETLIYKLKADLCLITEINIQPFQAYFQLGLPIYSAKSVRFRMGHLKSPTEMDCDLMRLPLHGADEKFIWTYTSQEFPMSQENRLQNFKLPEPVLCIGGYLQIELLGRVQKQETDNLFYICVNHVQVMGRSLFCVFGVNFLEPSGKFSLVYDAVVFPSVLRDVPFPISFQEKTS